MTTAPTTLLARWREALRVPSVASLSWAMASSWIALIVLVGGFAFAPTLVAPDSDDRISDAQNEGGPGVVRPAFYKVDSDTWFGGDVDDDVHFTLAWRAPELVWSYVGNAVVPNAEVIESTRRSITVRWRTRALGSRGPPTTTV